MLFNEMLSFKRNCSLCDRISLATHGVSFKSGYMIVSVLRRAQRSTVYQTFACIQLISHGGRGLCQRHMTRFHQ